MKKTIYIIKGGDGERNWTVNAEMDESKANKAVEYLNSIKDLYQAYEIVTTELTISDEFQQKLELFDEMKEALKSCVMDGHFVSGENSTAYQQAKSAIQKAENIKK